MVKRIISFVLALMIVSSLPIVGMADEYDSLRALGIMGDDMVISENVLITRAEMAYITAKIMNSGTLENVNTSFCDVDKENKYSGYIDFLGRSGVINGTGGCSFNPDGYVTGDVAYKMLLSALGYGGLAEEIGGYPQGYRTLASRLRIGKGVSVAPNNTLSTLDVAKILQNLLLTKLPSTGILIGDTSSELFDSGTTVLGDIMEISVYRGSVADVDISGGNITFIAEENVYDTNPVSVAFGTKLMLTADSLTKAVQYENIPAVAYVNKEKELLHIEADEDIEFGYRYVESVNSDANTSSMYSVRNMKEITFADDDDVYDVSDDAVMRYNGDKTNTSVKLIGKVAKVVIRDDEIIYLESWDLQHGGIITDINVEKITYQSGEKSDRYLYDVNRAENKYIVINGLSASYSDIKPDTLFEYYQNDDMLVLIVSESTRVDTLNAVSDRSFVTLGENDYYAKDVYYSQDGVSYKKNSGYNALFHVLVKAYIGSDGYVQYVKAYDKSDITHEEFYGVVCGVSLGTGLNTEKKVLIMNLEDTAFSKEIYRVDDRTKFNDGITISELNSNANALDGSSLYVFEASQSGKLISVSTPKPLKGYEDTTYDFSDGGKFINFAKRLYIDNNQPIIAVYENEGNLEANSITRANIAGLLNTDNSAMFKAYSKDGSIKLDLLLLTGDLNSLGGRTDSTKHGVVTSKRTFLASEDEIKIKITICGYPVDYAVTTEEAAKVREGDFVSFKVSPFGDSEISFVNIVHLDSDADSWPVLTTPFETSFAYIANIEGNIVEFSDGTIEPLSTDEVPVYIVYDSDSVKQPFTSVSKSEIRADDYVYCCKNSGIISALIAIR